MTTNIVNMTVAPVRFFDLTAKENDMKATANRPGMEGMHKFVYFTHGGLQLECYFDHQPHESQTAFDPGADEVLELCHAFHCDEDVFEIVKPQLKGFIETVALETMKRERLADDDRQVEFPRPVRHHSSHACFMG